MNNFILADLKIQLLAFRIHTCTFIQTKKETNELYIQGKGKWKVRIQKPSSLSFASQLPKPAIKTRLTLTRTVFENGTRTHIRVLIWSRFSKVSKA